MAIAEKGITTHPKYRWTPTLKVDIDFYAEQRPAQIPSPRLKPPHGAIIKLGEVHFMHGNVILSRSSISNPQGMERSRMRIASDFNPKGVTQILYTGHAWIFATFELDSQKPQLTPSASRIASLRIRKCPFDPWNNFPSRRSIHNPEGMEKP
ncbi:MAG: hypothetical protein ACM3XO_07865 [Bacteroidota bacterium]